MKGPPRLREGAGPAERLLRSAALDVPSARSRSKLLAVASTAAAGVVTTSAAAAASTATLAKSVALYVCLGTIGGGALALGASELSTLVLETPSSQPAALGSGQRAAAPRQASPQLLPLGPSQPAPEPSPVAPEAAKEPASVVRPIARDAAPAAAPPLAQPSLFDEVKLIETARAAVGRGDAGAALAALDRYDRVFPLGQFGPEALALRVEALSAAGNSARARALASEFARRYPSHPLLSRVRAAAP